MSEVLERRYSELWGFPCIRNLIDVKCSTLGSKTSYLNVLRKYVRFTGKNPGELVEEGGKDPKMVEMRVNGFLGLEGKPSTKAFRKAVVTKFYEFNDVTVNMDRLVKTRSEPEREDVVPTPERLDRLFRHASTRLKAMMSFQAFSALRFKGMSNVKLKHLRDLEIHGDHAEIVTMPMQIHVPRYVEGSQETFDKRGVKHETFMIEQGCRYVKEYLDQRMRRGEKLTGESYVVASLQGGKMSPQGIEQYIRTFFRRMGFAERPYVLKKYCENRMLASPVKETYQKYFTGWKSGQNLIKRYGLSVKLPQEAIEEMRREYAKAEPYLATERGRVDEKAEAVKRYLASFRTMGLLSGGEFEAFEEELRNAESIEEIEDIVVPKWRRMALGETTGNPGEDCEDGENCQRIVREDELAGWLMGGWEAKIVLPSGKIVVEKE